MKRVAIISVLALIVLAGAAPAQQDWTGTQAINLADQVRAALGAAPGDVNTFPFFALAGTEISFKVEAKGDLRVQVEVMGPDGQPDAALDTNVKKGGKEVKVKGDLSATGNHRIVVTALNDTAGSYKLKTKGTPPEKVSGEGILVAGVAEMIPFEALAGANLKKVKIKRTSGDLEPGQPTLDDPSDADVPFEKIKPKGKKLEAKKADLDETGTYELSFMGLTNTSGGYSYSLKISTPDVDKTKYEFNLVTGLPIGTLQELLSPVLAAADGYVGADTCKQCHAALYEKWSNSTHNQKMRATDNPGLTGVPVVADGDGNGIDDFRDGLDLRTHPKFAAFGADAPRLSYVPGDDRPYKITVGGIVFDVWYTIGGNGMWKQRYVLRLGDTHFISPVQFNEKSPVGVDNRYTSYHPEHWYDLNTNLPLLTNAATVAADVDTNNSYDRRCAGCHSTGLRVELDANSRFVMGMAEFNVGCEACHGAGAAHVAANGGSAADRLIVNPEKLMDGSAAGVLAADSVCGRCHHRGDSVDMLAGATKGFGYPWNLANGAMGADHIAAGQVIEDFYVQTTGASSYWDLKASGTFIASQKHHQQFIDQQNGPHASDQSWDGVCFDCHDPHGFGRKHMIAETMEDDGETVTVDNDDNSLCLTCHKGHGPYAALDLDDVKTIATGTPSAAVVQAVVDHMRDTGMPISSNAAYDPEGTGVGRCSKCHMVKMAKSAIWTADKAGYNTGDVHSHTFLPTAPIVSKITEEQQGLAVSNSCSVCHPTDPSDPVGKIIADYLDDTDDDGTFHPDVPSSFQNGVANHGNTSGGVACVACHTTRGFIEIQVEANDIHHMNGDADQGKRDEIIADAIGRDHGILCYACHGRDVNGSFQANNLRFPKADLCGRCHNDETVKFADFVADGEIVRHPQREMLAGTAGSEVSGTYSNSVHTNFADKCVTCHYDENTSGTDPNHTFEPNAATCNRCHTVPTFNRTAFADYDGSGTTQGIQDEVKGLLAALEGVVVDNSTVWRDGTYFVDADPQGAGYSQSTARKLLGAGVTAAKRRAVFNYYTVTFDASYGVHNAPRTLQLLQRSYKEVAGVDVPNASIR